MKPTNEEVKAAIEMGWAACDAFARDENGASAMRFAAEKSAAILRAHLETLDEREKAIEKIIAEAEIAIQDLGKKEWARKDQSYGGKLELAIAAYDALVAKREGTP